MSLPRRSKLPMNRPPTSPGEMLLEEYLKPAGITQASLAAKIGVHVQSINAIVQGHRSVTAAMAVKLGKALNTSPMFWVNLQNVTDLYKALKRSARKVHP